MTLKQIKKKYENNTAQSFEHIFKCQDGLICPLNRHGITLGSFAEFTDVRVLKRMGKYLIKYEKFREVVI